MGRTAHRVLALIRGDQEIGTPFHWSRLYHGV
jgi:hypothetical protein